MFTCLRAVILPVVCFLAMSTNAWGQATWMTSSGDWNIPGNWSTGTVPTAGTNVVFPIGTYTITITGAPAVCNTITFQSMADVSLNLNITVSGDVTRFLGSTMIMANRTISVGGNFISGGGTGNVNVGLNSTLILNGNIVGNGHIFNVIDNGNLQFATAGAKTCAATINVQGAPGTPALMTVQNGVTLDASGGAVNIQADAILRCVNTGSCSVSGITYSGASSVLEYTGTGGSASTNAEFPSPMTGSVVINKPTSAYGLTQTRTINGNFTLQAGNISLGGNDLTLNGNITFGAGTNIIGDVASTLAITGTGSITNILNFATTQQLRGLVMSNPGLLQIGSSLTLNATGFTVNNGTIRMVTAGTTLTSGLGTNAIANPGVLQINNGSRLVVQGASTLNLTGTNCIQVDNSASNSTLEFQGNPSTTTGVNCVQYLGANSRLLYTGAATKIAVNELPPTMPGRVIINKGAGNLLQINTTSALNAGLDVQSGECQILTGGNITFGAASQVQNLARFTVNAGSTISGANNLSLLAGSFLQFNGSPTAWTGTPTFAATSLLDYIGLTRATLPELPSPMNGDVRIQGGAAITLSASTIMNGNLFLLAGANSLTVPSPLVLTLANTGNSNAGTLAVPAGGECIVTGTLANSGTMTVAGTLTMSGAGALTGTSPSPFTGTLRYLNKTPTPYTTLAEFPGTVGNLIVNSAAAGDVIILQNAKTVSGNTTITQGILQSSIGGSSLTHNLGATSIQANGRLRVQENSTMNGTYTYSAPTATLEYAGTGAMTKSATAELTSVTPFGGSIIMNNTAHVDAPASLVNMNTAGANFTLTAGRWRIPAGGELRLGNMVGYLSGGATSYVELTPAPDGNNARLTRNLSVAANWHIGTPLGSYRFVQTGTPSVTPTEITIGASGTAPSSATATAPFISTFADGYWYFAANPASNVALTLRHPSVGATSRLGRFTNNGNANGAYTNEPATVLGNDITTTTAQALSPFATNFQYYAIGSGPAATSDIVAATGPAYTYTSPITIAQFGAAANLGVVSATSISLFEFDVRDNGGDGLPTVLNALNFTLADASGQLNQIGLFDGATQIGTALTAVSGPLSFTGLALSIPNGTTRRLSLRCTFKANVTDNANIGFTINSAVANPASSTFAAFPALASSVAGNDNRVSVVATTLTFPNAVGNQVVNTNFSPSVDVRAVDANNNLDADAAGTMTLTGAPIAVSAGGSVVVTAGIGSFNALQMASVGGGNTLTATLGALNAMSSAFAVNNTPTYWGCTIPSTPPALPVLGIGGRNMNFSNVAMALAPAAPLLGTVALDAAPNDPINISFDWNMNWPGAVYCPGCVVQMYVGIGAGSGVSGDGNNVAGTGFTKCIGTGVYNFSSGVQPTFSFTAPSKPGIYYITQSWTLHYYCNPHPVTFNNDPVNAIAVIRVVDPIPVSGGCDEADIIPTPLFTPPTNIPYTTYTGALTATHPEVWRFRIRDYGTIPTQGDIDNKPSTISSLGVTVNDPGGVLQEIALYDGTGLIQTQPVLSAGTSLVTFSGMPVALRPSAPDNGTKDYSIRARFRTTPLVPPMDNRQFSFSINQANVVMDAAAVSTQKAAFALAGPSSNAGNQNQVEVTATQLAFQTQPPATTPVGVNMASAVVVRAVDGNNNIDLDYTTPNIDVAHPNLISTPVSVAPVAGVATFPIFSFNNLVAAGTLNASSGALTAGTSNAFDITAAIFHFNAITANANTLTNWVLNGVGANPAALGLPGATYIVGAAPAPIATATVNTSFTINNGSTFQVNASSILEVANGQSLTNNGALNIQGNGTLRLLGSGTVPIASANNVTYIATTATLEYADPSPIPRSATVREIPAVNGRVLITRTGNIFDFNGSKTILGEFQQSGGGTININAGETLTLQGGSTFLAGMMNLNGTGALTVSPTGTFLMNGGNLNLNGTGPATINGGFSNPLGPINIGTSTLNLNGAINFGASGITNGGANSGTMRIGGSGTISGTFNNTSAGFGIFEMNRAGQTLVLAPGDLITSNLNLLNGIIQTAGTANRVEVTNTFTAVGGATTYIDGKLRRTLSTAALMNAGPFEFTIGKAGRYLPLVLYNVDAAANTGVEAEAISSAPVGGMSGSLFSSISTTEFWQTSQQGVGTLTSARVLLSRAAPVLPPAAVVGQNATQGGMYSGLGGTPSPPNVLSLNPVTTINRFFAIGSLPSSFFYNTGPAEIPGSWNSDINGSGAPALDFTTVGQSFIVPNGRTALFSADTTFVTGINLQVENGGTLAVQTGKKLTVNGLLRINGGGRLRLEGTGNVIAPVGVQYLAPNAFLEYNGANNRLVNDSLFASLPNPMNGSVELKNSTIILNNSKSLQGLTLDNSTLRFGAAAGNANRLTVNGAFTVSTMTPSFFVSESSNSLSILGMGAMTGSIGMSSNPQGALGSLTMNRSGQTLRFANSFTLATTLTLTAGLIEMPASPVNTSLVINNSSQTAIIGGSATSYVVGMLTRRLLPNLDGMMASSYAYPVGTSTRFLPMTLVNSTTGSVGAYVAVEGVGAGAGGTVVAGVNGSLSTSEYWRVLASSGEFVGGSVALRKQPLTSQNRVGTSLTRTGAYSDATGTLVNTPFGQSVQSASVQHGGLPFANVNSERFYAVLGILPNAPRITGFSPSSGGIGTMIHVTGASFTGVSAVAIAGVPVSSFTVVTDSLITASVANGVSGAVQVTSPIGGASSDSSFRFIPPPSIGTVSPSPAGYGTPITINGANLQNAIYLSIGGVQIPITPAVFDLAGNISIPVPLNASNATILIVTPGGSLESTNALVLVPRPVILSVAPQVASTGEVITVIGQNFQNTRFVRFGGGASGVVSTNAGFTINSPTRLSVIVPPQVRIRPNTTSTLVLEKNTASVNAGNGSVPITVETAGGVATSGTLAANEFYYRATTAGGSGTGGGVMPFQQVRVDAILDKITTLGSRVRVTGANLDFIVGIRLTTSLGATLASYQLGKTDMVILVPTTGLLANTTQTVSSVATTVEFFGAYNFVVVTNAFVLAGVPRATSIQPASAEAGENIFLSGDNLTLVTNVQIGGQTVPFQILPNGQVLVRVPVQTNTTGNTTPVAGTLVLTGVGGVTSASTTLVNPQYLTSQPVITSFSPSGGDGGTIIVVTGANFSNVSDVMVGGVTVASFIVNSPNRMTLILSTQATARSAGTIQLVTANGIVESRQTFAFTQSLESNIQTLAAATGLTVSALQARIVQFSNVIVGIDLSNTPLPNGQFPEYLRRLRGLKYLNLSNTGLTGPIPVWLGELKELEELDISFNKLTGELGSGVVCSYRNLRLLNVSFNRLEGPIPACIATLDKVQTLRLHNNRFSEKIPLEFGLMRSLRELTMQNNVLSGTLPASFGTNLNSKTIITLANAKQSSQIQAAQTLEIIDASNNDLSGGIPPEWGAMTALKTLNLAGNRLSGVLPSELGNMRSLEHLLLANNRFTGRLPASVSNLTNMQTLNLSGNGFTSAIPPEWTTLVRLRTVRLQGNALTGLVDWAGARRLDTVEVQQNRLDFAAIEPFVSIRAQASGMVNYSPQDSIGTAFTLEARIGEAVALTAQVGGSANRYQWYKNGIALPNAVQATVRYSAALSTDAGVYTCSITNNTVSGLTLWTRPQTLAITSGGLTLDAPTLVYPSNNAENIGVQTRLDWTRSSGSDGYEVQWARDTAFREGVERRYVTQIASDTTLLASTRITGLERGAQVFWRVRALAGDGSVGNEANASIWSERRIFTVVPLGVDLAVGTIDAGKASIGDEARGRSVAVNVGISTLMIDNISVDAADTARFRLKTAITQSGGILLASGAEFPIELAFTPRAAGITTGTLRVKYRDGQGTARETSFRAVARGNGSALSIDIVNFDTMRVGRTTLRTALLTNRSTNIVRVRGARLIQPRGQSSNDAVFTLRDAPTNTEPVQIFPGDVLPVVIASRPLTTGAKTSSLQVFSENNDTLEVDVRGFARLPKNTDAFLRVAVRPSADSVAPGGAVRMDVVIVEGNKQAILGAAQPTLRGTVRYSRQVLTLAPTERTARVLKERTQTSSIERVTIPPTQWDGRNDVLFSFDALAVAGDTDRTLVKIETLLWGGDNAQAVRQPWESQVFVEEPESALFTAKACIAGGKRLVTSAKATALAVLRPNPVKDVAELALTLREDDNITVELVNIAGKVVKTIAQGEYSAGEYMLQVNCADVPSGTYLVRLTTQGAVLTRSVQVVK